jgi:hypothetical protein
VARNAFTEEPKEIALLVPLTPIRFFERRDETERAAGANARKQRLYVRSLGLPIPDLSRAQRGIARFPIPAALDKRSNLIAGPQSLRLRQFEGRRDPSKVLTFLERRRAVVALVPIGVGGHLNHGQSSNWCR